MTRDKMIEQVARNLNDLGAAVPRFAPEILADYLEAATESCGNALLADPRGHRVLRRVSSSTLLVADQEAYDLPADCARLERVQLLRSLEDEWETLQRRRSSIEASVLRGTEVLLAETGAASATGPWGTQWTDEDCEDGAIRLYPVPATVAGEALRFVYLAAPAFPADAQDGFTKLPPGFDKAVVYLATALAASEELRDGRPIGAFGNLYRAKIGELLAGRGQGLAAGGARYIRPG